MSCDTQIRRLMPCDKVS